MAFFNLFVICGCVYAIVLQCVGMCMCRFCNVWVCTCVGFVMCECFDNCVGVLLTHCGRVTQICVFNTVKLGTSASSP